MISAIYFLQKFISENPDFLEKEFEQELLEKYFFISTKNAYQTIKGYLYSLRVIGVIDFVPQKKIKINKEKYFEELK